MSERALAWPGLYQYVKFFIHLFVVLFNSFKPSVYSAAAKDNQNILRLLTVISSTYICFDCWVGGRAAAVLDVFLAMLAVAVAASTVDRQTQTGRQASNMVSKENFLDQQ